MDFYEHPTKEALIDTLFPMYHLREWIYQGRQSNYFEKTSDLSQEVLDKKLCELPEYLVIKSMCNHTRHYSCNPKKNPKHETVEINGSTVGLMKCGDALNSSYFLVDGRDARGIFMEVYRVYYEYFESKKHDFKNFDN